MSYQFNQYYYCMSTMYGTCTASFLYSKNCHLYVFLIWNYLFIILVQENRERKVFLNIKYFSIYWITAQDIILEYVTVLSHSATQTAVLLNAVIHKWLYNLIYFVQLVPISVFYWQNIIQFY